MLCNGIYNRDPKKDGNESMNGTLERAKLSWNGVTLPVLCVVLGLMSWRKKIG